MMHVAKNSNKNVAHATCNMQNAARFYAACYMQYATAACNMKYVSDMLEISNMLVAAILHTAFCKMLILMSQDTCLYYATHRHTHTYTIDID